MGYVTSAENVPDVKSSLGIHIASKDECANLCFRFDECVSFEHNKNERKCILNPKGSLHSPYEGYLFCYNIGNMIVNLLPISINHKLVSYNFELKITIILSASVNCGNRTARSCNLCPETEEYDREETWCNGDCEWNKKTYSCIEKTI